MAERAAPEGMRRLTEGATTQGRRDRAERLGVLIDKRLRSWHDVLATPAGDQAALSARLRQGKQIMDDVRGTLAEMLRAETESLARRSAARDALLRRNRWIVGSSVVGGVGGGLAVAWVFMSGVLRRVQRLESDARTLAEGQPLPASKEPARDEIGKLESGLRSASGLLIERERALRVAADEITDLYEHAPCGYHSIGADGTFLRMNATELHWLGYTADEVIGRRRFTDIITPASREVFDRHFPVFRREGQLRDVEFELVRKDGSTFPVSLSASAIFDDSGSVLASRSTLFDITERRGAEKKVAELNAELQRRLAEQAALNKELEAFSYSVSHDLRAPLRSIDGFAQALVEDYEDRLDDAGRGYLARVRAAAQRMGLLIDDMLMLSRVSRAEMRGTHVNISAMAAEIAARLAEQDPARRAEWRIDENIRAVGDQALLHAVLENLLGNAWKFTSKVPDAVIAVESRPAPDGYTGFVVRDNGAGFDMQYADKLFGVFQRLHSATEFPGTGVGLASVQRIVVRHGGRVRAEGTPGAGAALFVELPISAGVPAVSTEELS
jgi:PAS domain S-box-containing protein